MYFIVMQVLLYKGIGLFNLYVYFFCLFPFVAI